MERRSKNLKYYQAVGRRKEAVAQVRLYLVNKDKAVTIKNSFDKTPFKMRQGEIYVNGQPIDKIFPNPAQKVRYLFPLKITNNKDRFAISILVRGGGKNGWLEAITYGLSRALEKVDREYRPILKKYGLLTRDARIKERRKVGTGGKARREKQSPKR